MSLQKIKTKKLHLWRKLFWDISLIWSFQNERKEVEINPTFNTASGCNLFLANWNENIPLSSEPGSSRPQRHFRCFPGLSALQNFVLKVISENYFLFYELVWVLFSGWTLSFPLESHRPRLSIPTYCIHLQVNLFYFILSLVQILFEHLKAWCHL